MPLFVRPVEASININSSRFHVTWVPYRMEEMGSRRGGECAVVNG